jgi:hypothetical protein
VTEIPQTLGWLGQDVQNPYAHEVTFLDEAESMMRLRLGAAPNPS